MLSLSVTIDPSALAAALNRLPTAMDCRRGPMHDAMARASRRLMEFEQRHFVQSSGGGGGWPPLAPSTIAARLRRQMKAAGSKKRLGKHPLLKAATLPMLYVTGTLESGLYDTGGPGHFQRFDKDSVTEGVDGGSHPDFKGSVSALATIHQYGGGNVPARPVYVPPDAQAVGLIGADLHNGFTEAVASLAYGGAPQHAGYGTP